MVEDIYKLKNEILKQVKKEVEERGAERIDVNRIGAMIDMVHHLAEAEENCWEAQYYRAAVSNSMEQKYGHMPQDSERMGYGGGTGSSARMGYGSNMGYDSMGYGGDIIEELKRTVMATNPEERMRLKNEINSIVGSM